MPQSLDVNRRFVLASRPHGAPTAENFRLETHPVPVPNEGGGVVANGLDGFCRGKAEKLYKGTMMRIAYITNE